ncbi:MAG: hypothetical protein KBC41_00350 [Candidatus Pacebacteria bacterium]|nr:hypothetical protein [Candidatus Paceibacterota bacterium]MBP9866517.1 hypothetical protein [Candidatus Paceibacterota bacterium]
MSNLEMVQPSNEKAMSNQEKMDTETEMQIELSKIFYQPEDTDEAREEAMYLYATSNHSKTFREIIADSEFIEKYAKSTTKEHKLEILHAIKEKIEETERVLH